MNERGFVDFLRIEDKAESTIKIYVDRLKKFERNIKINLEKEWTRNRLECVWDYVDGAGRMYSPSEKQRYRINQTSSALVAYERFKRQAPKLPRYIGWPSHFL